MIIRAFLVSNCGMFRSGTWLIEENMLGLSTFVNMTDRAVPSRKEREYLRYHIVKALCFIQP